MASPRGPEEALFFTGVLASGPEALAAARQAVVGAFGEPCLESPDWDFDNSDYYRDELGPSPLRRFWAFPGLFHPGGLAERKLSTNALEARLALELGGPHPRPVNLDPGYVTLAKLVLASVKNFSHRLYIGQGIYAEVTMRYSSADRDYAGFPWTFPDFKSGRYTPFFLAVRERLKKTLRKA